MKNPLNRIKAWLKARQAEKEIKKNPDIDEAAKKLIKELSNWGNHLNGKQDEN